MFVSPRAAEGMDADRISFEAIFYFVIFWYSMMADVPDVHAGSSRRKTGRSVRAIYAAQRHHPKVHALMKWAS